jgi:hypothetical protein
MQPSLSLICLVCKVIGPLLPVFSFYVTCVMYCGYFCYVLWVLLLCTVGTFVMYCGYFCYVLWVLLLCTVGTFVMYCGYFCCQIALFSNETSAVMNWSLGSLIMFCYFITTTTPTPTTKNTIHTTTTLLL